MTAFVLDRPVVAAPPATLAELMTRAAQDPGLSPTQQKACATHLRTIALVVGRSAWGGIASASAIPCDVAWLNDRLFRLPPKAHGLTKQSFGNAVSSLRLVLHRAGLIDPRMSVELSAHSPWKA